MSVDRLLTRDVLIVHRAAGGMDDYGNEIMVETETPSPCYLEQRRSTEPAGVGERAATDWLVVLPAGTPITVADAIRSDDGTELEVTTDPWPVHDPWQDRFSHIELIARETA